MSLSKKLNILTPFYRKQNFHVLSKSFKQADSWTCIVTKKEHFDSYGEFFKKTNTIVEYVCNDVFGDAAYCKINRYINENRSNINNNDYYMFLMDDEYMPLDFMNKFRTTKTDSPVIFVSTKRGHKIPPRMKHRHGIEYWEANPNNIKVGSVSFCQLIVKGFVLKQMRFVENKEAADGMMAVWLKNNFPVFYAPDLFIKFNYLERGRWMIPMI